MGFDMVFDANFQERAQEIIDKDFSLTVGSEKDLPQEDGETVEEAWQMLMDDPILDEESPSDTEMVLSDFEDEERKEEQDDEQPNQRDLLMNMDKEELAEYALDLHKLVKEGVH